jgi:hypothetical protein
MQRVAGMRVRVVILGSSSAEQLFTNGKVKVNKNNQNLVKKKVKVSIIA